MKTLSLLALLFISPFLNQQDYQPAESKDYVAELLQQNNQIPKATAIFWIDKAAKKEGEPLNVRTVKAKVNIQTDGTVHVLSYVNQQPREVQSYIRRKLETFRVTQVMLKSGYVKVGEQYVQLRYIKSEVNK